jgi:hydrogenase nickel incorporation protein HypA/HybF
MHELSVCQALLNQVAELVRTRGAQTVASITIEVGPLCGTEPDLLFNAFMVMRSGSTAAARLDIRRAGVEIVCLLCGVHSETPPNRLICSRCGAWRIRVLAGDELRLLRVEMQLPESESVDYV